MRPVPEQPCMALIRAFEGFGSGKHEATRNRDSGGRWEIGWSHRLSGPEDPLWDKTLDRVDADGLAMQDLNDAAAELWAELGARAIADLNDGQWAALIDFVYNVGIANFKGSTLRDLVYGGNLTKAYSEFPKWKYEHVNGKPVERAGLVKRRAAEQDVWRLGNAS